MKISLNFYFLLHESGLIWPPNSVTCHYIYEHLPRTLYFQYTVYITIQLFSTQPCELGQLNYLHLIGVQTETLSELETCLREYSKRIEKHVRTHEFFTLSTCKTLNMLCTF